MNYEQLSAAVATYVSDFYETHLDERYVYHNLDHTKSVVAASTQMADHYQLSPSDYFIVTTAAWFHDIGYYTDPNAHEAEGASAAEKMLTVLQVDTEVVVAVKGCILATRIPQDPKNKLEEIVCDADLFHLGGEGFKEKNRLMREEKSRLDQIAYNKDAWRASTILFLQSHHYHTDYAKMLLDDKKAAHLIAMQEKQQEKESEKEKAKAKGGTKGHAKHRVSALDPDAEQMGLISGKGHMEAATDATALAVHRDADARQKSEKKDKKNTRPDKGIETMFRVTAGNNQKLSNMADNKAHIMISVNSIILSAVISLLLRKLDSNESLAIPTYFLITVCVLTIIYSILATRPTIPRGTFTQTDIEEKKTNLLFFGNFYKMPLDEYTAGMLKVMDDSDFLYGSLIKDVYAQGVVLGKKYRLLRTSYNIFMYGLILSVIAFIIASVIAIH